MILLAGASGFLGQHLCRYLCDQEKKVAGIYHSSSPSFQHENLHYYKIDLLDYHSLEECVQSLPIEIIIDAAAQVSYGNSGDSLIQNNVRMTENLANIALQESIALLKISSIAALGSPDEDGLIHEDSQWDPKEWHSAYALSKKQSEMEIWRAMAEGLEAMILCPGIILGLGNPSSMSDKFTRVLLSDNKYYTEGASLFIDVQDLCRMIGLCLDTWKPGEKYIAGGNNLDFKTLVNAVDEAKGIKTSKIGISEWMGIPFMMFYNLGKILQGKKSILNKETRKMLFSNEQYATDKFQKEFPDFQYTPIVDSFRNFLAQESKSLS